jgi:hypothetical protein
MLLFAWRLLAIRSKLPCITFSPKFSEAAGETSANYCEWKLVDKRPVAVFFLFDTPHDFRAISAG